MTAQLSTDPPEDCRIGPIPLPVEVPEGFWSRETTHAPQPWTRFTEVVLGETVSRGLRRMYAEFGGLFETVEYRKIGGWEYVRLVPLGGKQPPLPAWLAPVAFRVVPALRRRIRRGVDAARADAPGELLRRWTEVGRSDLATRAATLREVDFADLDHEQLDRHMGDVLALAEHGLLIHFRLHGPIAFALAELAFTCRDLLGWDEAKVLSLLVGTSRTSTAPARALAAVAAGAAERPEVRRLLEDGAPARTVLGADASFAAMFDDYQREFGCRASGYEIADPCLDEQPDLALALIRDQLATGYDPDSAEEANRAQRANARAEALRRLDGRGPAARHRFERVLERALMAYPVREDNEFFTASAPFAITHRAAREIGRRLAAAGLLDSEEDAFHLEPAQLRAALRGGRDCRVQARTRAGERAWALANPGPASYGPPPGPPPPLSALPPEVRLVNEAILWAFEQIFSSPPASGDLGDPDTDMPAVSGVGASAGSYTGRARIVRGESEFDRLQPGDVLVCPATSPVWSVLFAGIGALVTDGGGLLSHQAIIAREYGIPAVVGTHDGTARLTDGQLVTVDGTAGTVEVAR